MHSLVFIVGPTAVGKTKWAIEGAYQHSAGILNSDSIQVYKDLKIGSAQPDFAKYSDISFYLFNQISAPQVWTAGKFRRQALDILKKTLPEKKMLIVGASGFYIQALEKGMYPFQPVPPSVINNLKETLKTKGLDYLYQELKNKDPETARQISPKDNYRIFRSLSLIESEGEKLSQIKKNFKEQKLPWSYRKVGLNLPKEKLLEKVKIRTQDMLKKGLIEETENLVKKGFHNWRPLHSIGYKQVLLYLDGKIKKEDLLEEIVSNTMTLAKKQKTWFKKDPDIQWINEDQRALKVYKEIFK